MWHLAFVTLIAALPILAATPASQDGSAPRAALLLYDKLVGPNQSDKALGLYHATTTRERALAGSLANLDGALANLHHQAAKKFGKPAADGLVRTLDGVTVADINAAKITVTGDTAAVTFPASDHPTAMVRVGDEWKISVKSLVQNLRSRPRDFRKSLAKLATAANQTAAKIEQGQHSTSDGARKELRAAYRSAFGRPDED